MSDFVGVDLRVVGLAVVFCAALAVYSVGFGESSADVLSQTPANAEVYSCSGEHGPGFVCPNAAEPDYSGGAEPVLSAKCGGCPNQKLNGGNCSGKYL